MIERRQTGLRCAIRSMEDSLALLKAAETGIFAVPTEHVEAFVAAAEVELESFRHHLDTFKRKN